MKKILYSAAAIALAFFSASCQQENLEPTVGGTVTYTVQVPDAIATKAFGDGITGVTKLIYEVYKEDEYGTLTEVLYESDPEQPVVIDDNGKFTFELEFIKNHNYTVLFWAYNPAAQDCYNTEHLTAVTLNQRLVANNEAMAVFSGSDKVRDCQSVNNGNVTLVRPVAQINIVTNNESLAVGSKQISLKQSSLVVKGLSDTYNVADKSVGSEGKDFQYVVEDNQDNIPSVSFAIGSDTYTYVAMNYVGFVPELGDNVDLNLTINTSEGNIFHEISNVPVKPNYRTNIYGNLITASSDYAVELKADWTDVTGGNMEVIADGLVKNINGDYEVTNAAGLAYAINNLFVDANGVANNKSFYVKPGIYDMAQQAINDITVTSGTLKVYDTDAVVTRSVTIDGVVITGLKKPLINTVEENATVFFSGITIQNFEGDNQDEDQNGALVGDNNGKVVLKDCNIVDKDGTNDEDNKLVGGNDPEVVEDLEEPANGLIYTAAQLSEAFADETVESIVLGADITLENTLVFPTGRTATLDLRGWKLTIADPAKFSSTYAINNLGTLTIKDSYGIGEVNACCIYNGYVVDGEPINDAMLTINGAHFNNPYAYVIENYSELSITGDGKMEGLGGIRSHSGEVTIEGGTFTASSDWNEGTFQHILKAVNTEATINGGVFDATIGGITNAMINVSENSTVTIKGGEFRNVSAEVVIPQFAPYMFTYEKNGKLIIEDGTFYGGWRFNGETASTDIYGGDFTVSYDGQSFHANSTHDLTIYGGTFRSENGGKLNPTNYVADDYKAVYNEETGIWNVVPKDYVAKIGAEKFESLQEALDAVQEGETIVLMNDVNVTSPAQGQNALNYSKAVNCTIDLNGKTLAADTGNSVFRFNIKESGATQNVTVTLKNGTITSGDNTWCTVMAAGLSDKVKAVFNLENLTINSSKPGDLAVKAWDYSLINAKNVTVNATKTSGGFYAVGGEIVLENCTVDQQGLNDAPYLSMAVAVSNNGKMTVQSGSYTTEPTSASEGYNQGTSHGSWAAGVMNSGGELIINGGTFANGNFGEDNLATYARGLIFGDTASKIVINDGTFNALKSIIDYQNNLGVQPNPNIIINGGNFSADPSVVTSYGGVVIADGKAPVQGEDGRWTLVERQSDKEIWYTATAKVEAHAYDERFGTAKYVSNEWDEATGKGVIKFDAPVTIIGVNAFYEDNDDPHNLTSISFPDSVTEIGKEAFKGCKNLTTVNFGNGLKVIGEMAFQSCGFTSVVIPEGVTTIGTSAFNSCLSMTTVVMPSTLTTIGDYAFNGCKALTSVTIPAGVTMIGNNAFASLGEVNVYLKPNTPPTIYGNNPFGWWATIYVPSASLEAYKSAWSTLENEIQTE